MVELNLELVQGPQRVLLSTVEVPKNGDAALDPRTRHADLLRLLTQADINAFEPGPALLRATATGRPQWMRTPPPTVKEISVRIGTP